MEKWFELKGVDILLFFLVTEHLLLIIKAIISLAIQAQDRDRIFNAKNARKLYRMDHERKEDKRLSAYKFVGNKLSNLFYRDGGEEKAARDAAAA